MNVFNRKTEKNRNSQQILQALQLVIPAVILTADDLWCVTNDQAKQLVQGSFEIIEGYDDVGRNGLKMLHEEFADRGFQIELRGGFDTPAYNPIPQRGRGEWVKDGKLFKCSRCGTKSIKRNYCAECGADMRKKDV
jgi:hypothetical protein